MIIHKDEPEVEPTEPVTNAGLESHVISPEFDYTANACEDLATSMLSRCHG